MRLGDDQISCQYFAQEHHFATAYFHELGQHPLSTSICYVVSNDSVLLIHSYYHTLKCSRNWESLQESVVFFLRSRYI